VTPEQASSKTGDAVCHSYEVPSQQYAGSVNQNLQTVNDSDYQPTKSKGAWDSDVYEGINGKW